VNNIYRQVQIVRSVAKSYNEFCCQWFLFSSKLKPISYTLNKKTIKQNLYRRNTCFAITRVMSVESIDQLILPTNRQLKPFYGPID